jgi:hypothetical protein
MDPKDEILAIRAFYQDRADKLESTYSERVLAIQKVYDEKSKAGIADVRKALDREVKMYSRVAGVVAVIAAVAAWLGFHAVLDYVSRNQKEKVDSQIAESNARFKQELRDIDDSVNAKIRTAVEERFKNSAELMGLINGSVQNFAANVSAEKMVPLVANGLTDSIFLRKDTPYAIVACQRDNPKQIEPNLVLSVDDPNHGDNDHAKLAYKDGMRWVLMSK